ncbi:hypothetical protein BURPS668_A3292 [Burkholderia pseudomallei 668]|nr:hypothetical protein BURPS668_A3292 [Burkholderia pseudomallei 668]
MCVGIGSPRTAFPAGSETDYRDAPACECVVAILRQDSR